MVQIVWLWLSDCLADDEHGQANASAASMAEGVLEYLLRRSQGYSPAVSSAKALACRGIALARTAERSGASNAEVLAMRVRQNGRLEEARRLEEEEQAADAATAASNDGARPLPIGAVGARAAAGMLRGLAKLCAASYEDCGGIRPWAAYADDGRGRRPPPQVIDTAIAALRRADMVWLVAKTRLDGEGEAEQAMALRRRARHWLHQATR